MEISAQGQKLNADLTRRFNSPGAYNANLTPTATGSFVFKFTGNIDGTAIDETFTAGPSTFGLIEEPKAFPQGLPAIQDIALQVAALKEGASTSAGSSNSSSDIALIVAIAGVILGGAGFVLGGLSYTKRAG